MIAIERYMRGFRALVAIKRRRVLLSPREDQRLLSLREDPPAGYGEHERRAFTGRA